MMLMMVFAAFILLVLPKAMESMDPDMMKDMKDRQGRILNIQNQLQTGDYSGLASGLLATGEAPKPSGSAPPPRRGGAVAEASPSHIQASSANGGKKGAGGGGGGNKKKR